MLKKLKTVSSESKFVNPYWEYKFDKYSTPGGDIADYHWVCSRGSTMIVPKLDNNKFILIRQFRYLNGKESIEFPGGGVRLGADYETNAREELEQETGYESENLTLIGSFNPFNGVTNEICKVFLAESLVPTIAIPDKTEEFELLKLSQREILEMIASGEIWDGMTLAAWSIYFFSQQNRDLQNEHVKKT